ncbi:MAG: hypothetical protein ABI765_05905, partial [Gemmatimonadota bacterium]
DGRATALSRGRREPGTAENEDHVAIGSWHSGKVILLWAVVILFYWRAREVQTAVWGFVFVGAFLFALIVTVRWISARERRPPA